MKIFKYGSALGIAIFGMILMLTNGLYSGERPKSQFSTYQEAKESGLMTKGWIPTFIPRSTTNISEQHDLDTNWVKMSFNYDPQDLAQTREACELELKLVNGKEFNCTYHGSSVKIKLYDNGEGTLYSASR